MQFRINTDSWFIFSMLFICALALFVLAYIVFPYLNRKKSLRRIKGRGTKKKDHFKALEMKYSDLKIFKLQVENQALQIDLKDDLQKIQHSQSPDLLPFYSNFEKIYPKFRPSLQKIISDITANELKLCALLRLNLSSKEIAQLLNITPESVNKARYRLRKKIALNSNDDLVIFLTSI
jgi:DNA-binding CsgD family transcriptional regulator